MLHEASDSSVRGDESVSSRTASEMQAVAEDIWDNVKDIVGQKRDNFEYNFSKSTDLSNRKTPGVFRQYKYFLGRVGKQRLREARIQGVDFLILCLAGVCLGTLAKVSDETFGALGYTYTVIAVLVCAFPCGINPHSNSAKSLKVLCQLMLHKVGIGSICSRKC